MPGGQRTHAAFLVDFRYDSGEAFAAPFRFALQHRPEFRFQRHRGAMAGKGERTSKAYKDKVKISEDMKIFAMSWISAATLPVSEGGLGLSNEAAVGCIGELSIIDKDKKAFRLTEQSLLTYWTKHPELRNVEFKLSD